MIFFKFKESLSSSILMNDRSPFRFIASHTAWLFGLNPLQRSPVVHEEDPILSDPSVQLLDFIIVGKVLKVAALTLLRCFYHLNHCLWQHLRAVSFLNSILNYLTCLCHIGGVTLHFLHFSNFLYRLRQVILVFILCHTHVLDESLNVILKSFHVAHVAVSVAWLSCAAQTSRFCGFPDQLLWREIILFYLFLDSCIELMLVSCRLGQWSAEGQTGLHWFLVAKITILLGWSCGAEGRLALTFRVWKTTVSIVMDFASNVKLDFNLIVLMFACLVSLHIDLATGSRDYQWLVFIVNYSIRVFHLQVWRPYHMIGFFVFKDQNSITHRWLTTDIQIWPAAMLVCTHTLNINLRLVDLESRFILHLGCLKLFLLLELWQFRNYKVFRPKFFIVATVGIDTSLRSWSESATGRFVSRGLQA